MGLETTDHTDDRVHFHGLIETVSVAPLCDREVANTRLAKRCVYAKSIPEHALGPSNQKLMFIIEMSRVRLWKCSVTTALPWMSLIHANYVVQFDFVVIRVAHIILFRHFPIFQNLKPFMFGIRSGCFKRSTSANVES